MSKKANDFLNKVYNNKVSSTVRDVRTEFTKGAYSGIEGAVDFLALGLAEATSFLPNVSESIQAFAERNLTEELYESDSFGAKMLTMNPMDLLINPNSDKSTNEIRTYNSQLDKVALPLSKISPILNDVQGRDVINQVGRMLPSIAAGNIAAGAGAGAGLTRLASLGTMGLSAGGTSAVEALGEGATLGQSLLYGTASGAMEAATEMMFDAFGLFGGGAFDKIIPATTIAGRLTKGVLGEAAEEAVSEAASPLLKQIYDKNAIQEAKDNPGQYWADIANSAIMGGVTSLAMAPLGSGNIVDDAKTIDTLNERQRTLEANGKLTTEKAAKINEQLLKARNNIQTKLQKMNETERAKTIQALKLKGFDENGAYTAKTYDRAKYSTVGTELHNVQEIASKAGFEVSTELTQDQEKVFKTVRKNLAKLQNKGLDTDGIVVVKENQTNAGQTFAGANADGIIFVNENRLNELNSALQTLAHESTHSLPCTLETLALMDAVMNDEENGQAVRDVLNNYDVTQEEWDDAKKSFENGTADEQKVRIVEETGAAFSENVLGNEEAMRVLTRNNSGLVVKAYNSLCDAIRLKQLSGEARSQYKTMLEYAKAFEKAMTSEGITFKPMVNDDEEDETKYSVKKETNDEYMELAKDPEKNDSKLRRTVERAAFEAGFDNFGYHGTKSQLSELNSIKGYIFMTSDSNLAKRYGDNVIRLAGTHTYQMRVDAEGSMYYDIPTPERMKRYTKDERVTTEEIMRWAKKDGYDSVRIDNVCDPPKATDIPGNPTTVYVYFDSIDNLTKSNTVKSLEKVTYDDNGNVIPLSERFNTQNDDIRYSKKKTTMTEEEAVGQIVKARNEKNTSRIMDIAREVPSVLENNYARNLMKEAGVTEEQFAELNKIVETIKANEAKKAEFEKVLDEQETKVSKMTERLYQATDNLSYQQIADDLREEVLDVLSKYPQLAKRKSFKPTMEELGITMADVEKISRDRTNENLRERLKQSEERAAYAIDNLKEMRNRFSEMVRKERGAVNLIHQVTLLADELHAMTDRKYAQTHDIPVSANLYTDEEFSAVVKASKKLFHDGLLNPKKVRTQIYEVAKLLSQKEVFDKYVKDVTGSEDSAEVISSLLSDTMETFKEHFDENANAFNNDALTYEELRYTKDLLSFVKHVYTHYDTVFRDGKAYSAEQLSVKEQSILEKSRDVNVNKNKSNLFKTYKQWFTTPISVFEHMELYDESGELTRLSRELRRRTWLKQTATMELTEKLDEFGKKNKHFLKRIRNERVTVEGKSMLLTEFINMRAQFTQENGRLTIEEGGGVIFHDENGNKSQPTHFSEAGIEEAWNKLGPEVHEYYDIIYEIANEGGKLKAETDIQLYGFTDVKGDGKYFQIRRERRYFKSSAGDASKMSANVQDTANSDINKKRSTKAKGIPIAAQDSFSNITEYVNQVTNYYAYAVTLSEFRKIYNKQTETGKSMRFMCEEAWDGDTNESGADKYITKYLNDVQGVKIGETFAKLGKWRGAYAQAQLGMNIKVIGGQFCSFPTAFAYLNISDMQKGLLMKTDYETMTKYSLLARTRFADKSAFKAETLTDNVNAIGAIGSIGIGWADKMTIGKIWNACVSHFAENYTGDELYTKAAELFDEVVTNTQPTYQASDRSQFQRSNNELVKSFAMFTSVPMKQISELFSAIDRVHTFKAMKKAGYHVSEANQTAARTRLAKTVTGVVVANAIYAAMCQLVKHIFDKDEEEDNDGKKWYEQMGMQFLETNVSMFPVMKELYGYFFNGYDLDVNIIGAANDLLSSVKSLISADSVEDFNKGLKNITFYGCMMVGIPARNTYNLIYGLTKRFSKPTAMKIDAWFREKKTYGSALNKAVENGDDKMIAAIVDIQSGVDGLPSVYNKLIKQGYTDILPKSVGGSFTYDGEQYKMTTKEQKKFQETYNGYVSAVSNMSKTVVFKAASEGVQAKAIKAIQNTYWQMAIDDTVGDETTAKLYVFSKAINIGKLAVITEQCKSYSADTDKSGDTISGSKKAKIVNYLKQTDLTKSQQALVLCYLGYADSSNKTAVKNYINSLSISKKEKELMYSMCGY